MRKLLISILIFLLLFITVYSIVKGLSIGDIKILSFNSIKQESEQLDVQIAEITKLKEQDYKKTISDIESNVKLLLQEKEKYAKLISTSTDTELQKATSTEKYEQEFLWAKIGNHATAQGVELKFDIALGTLNKENYDLYFEVIGTYANITEFIMAIENDNLLGFKIENFEIMNEVAEETTNTTTVEYYTGRLVATFVVTDISINIDRTKITSSPNNTTTGTNTNVTTTNTTTEKNNNNTTTGNTETKNTTTEGTEVE